MQKERTAEEIMPRRGPARAEKKGNEAGFISKMAHVSSLGLCIRTMFGLMIASKTDWLMEGKSKSIIKEMSMIAQ